MTPTSVLSHKKRSDENSLPPLSRIWNMRILYEAHWRTFSICTACRTRTRYTRIKIKFYCPRFICTAGGEKVSLRTNLVNKDYPIEPLEAVSTIGAGDNFNAGLIYGLLKYDVRYRDLNNLNEATWDKVIQCGKDFAAEVCRSFSNSVSVEFAESYK